MSDRDEFGRPLCQKAMDQDGTRAEIERLRRIADTLHEQGVEDRADNERLRGLLRDGRSNTVALLQVLRDAARHLPAKAPIDMPEANRVTSEVVEWIARIDAALGAADQPEPQSGVQE